MTMARETVSPPLPQRPSVVVILVALACLLILGRNYLPTELLRPPEWLILPFADWINAIFAFLRDDLGLMQVTRAFAAVVDSLLDTTANILYGKNRWPRLGPLPWSVVALSAAALGWWLGGWRLAALAGGTFVW